MTVSTTFRGLILALVASAALALPACEWDGHFTVLGYTTKPNYDLGIRTVRVPIFENHTFYRGIEFDVTEAVIREIHAKTPYRVVSDGDADTELTGKIISFNKNILNRNQLNEVREAETLLGAEAVWRNLRTGEILSSPRSKTGEPVILPPDAKPTPALVKSTAGFIPELGESFATARKKNADRLAVQIISMMESPW